MPMPESRTLKHSFAVFAPHRHFDRPAGGVYLAAFVSRLASDLLDARRVDVDPRRFERVTHS